MRGDINTISDTLKIAIIGYGRFGKTLHRLLNEAKRITKNNLEILIFDPYIDIKDINWDAKHTTTLKDIYKNEPNYVFFCVPINKFKDITFKHVTVASRLKKLNKVVFVDVLSVKMHPYKVFKGLINKYPQLKVVLTHPMFGPDSSKNGFKGLRLVMYNQSAPLNVYEGLKSIFKSVGIKIVEMSPKEHDKLAAYSQGVTHFIGRMLDAFGFKSTPIDTQGAKLLQQVMEQTTNDTFELFKDLQHYNPFTLQMRLELGKAYNKVFNKLIPKQVYPNVLTVGIQGGEGSFNHQAILKYLRQKGIKNYKIKYLYTTEKVLYNLYVGKIDLGIFAVHNAAGGIVWESAKAMAEYTFKIVDEIKLKITHHLMKRKDVKAEDIASVIAHPQVFKQCKNTLKKQFPHLKQIVGEGDLIDTALAAKALAKGELSKTTAILGPKILADIYDGAGPVNEL